MKEQLTAFMKRTNGKRMWQFIFILLLGVMLMYMGKLLDNGAKNGGEKGSQEPMFTEAGNKNDTAGAAGEYAALYEKALEDKLAKTLSLASGVGNVEVALTLSYRDEIELAKDTTHEITQATDAVSESGRINQTERKEIRHLLVAGKDGLQEPIIIKRIEPKIEGVIIVAEGGNNAAVKASLTKAAGALLNLEAHKIEIMEMGK